METIKLDLIPGKKMPSLHASQFDDGREHGIDLFENGVAYMLDGTETLTINERKGDDCICSLDIENTFTGSNHIVFASTEQMCAVWGNNICELVIAKGEKKLGTLNFILEIEPSPTEGGIESESEISNLERQITEITEQVIGDDYYTAEQTDEKFATNRDLGEVITIIDGELDRKADKNNTYTKTEVDISLNNKMNKSNPTGTGRIAVGQGVVASGAGSQAFGIVSTASGLSSHAEGFETTASGESSHTEGNLTTASGRFSHAEGNQTIASGRCQHVSGMCNVVDNNNQYLEIVGNGGNSYARSNARTLDWQGNETLAGDLTFNGGTRLSSEISRLDGRIDDLPAPMIFKGTLGVGGTIQTLPTASASNEGFTYKVITDGTYAGQTAKVGDVFTSNGSAWVLIPSGDEDNDTWRAIKVEGVEKLGNGISSGSVDFVGSENIDVEFDSNGNKVGIKTKNIYTKTEVDNIVSDAIYNVLPDDTASGSVANFNTSLALPLKSLEIDVNAVQEAGTPTPTTPLPISGWSAITLDANGNTEVINLGDTYYGGYVTQDKDGHRRLVVTHKRLELSTLTEWSRITNYTNPFFRATLPNDCKVRMASNNPQIAICDSYAWYSSNQNYWQYIGNGEFVTAGFGVSSVNRFYIRNDDYTDKNTFVSSLSGVYIVYELATPVVIDLPDGEPINTLAGVNNFYADTGDTEVVFKSSVNDYVSAHSGGNLLGMGGVYLGGAKSGGSEEEPDEGEDTEKTKLDEPKEEIKTIGDIKK